MPSAVVPEGSLFWRAPRAACDDETIVEVPPRIPGYRLLRPIGRGRNTRAWLAFDLNKRLDVVLKLEAAPGHSLDRDCAVAGRVQGPNLVQIHSQGRTAAWAWLAMEHLPGGDLGVRMGRALPRDEALAILCQAAGAVAQLHRHGLVHRDVKPGNFLLRADGSLVLADFGLTVDAGSVDAGAAPGARHGPPPYVAPEQIQGAPAAPAAAVDTLEEVLAQHLLAVPARLPAEAADLQPLADRMLCREPQGRLPDADAVLGLMGQRC